MSARKQKIKFWIIWHLLFTSAFSILVFQEKQFHLNKNKQKAPVLHATYTISDSYTVLQYIKQTSHRGPFIFIAIINVMIYFHANVFIWHHLMPWTKRCSLTLFPPHTHRHKGSSFCATACLSWKLFFCQKNEIKKKTFSTRERVWQIYAFELSMPVSTHRIIVSFLELVDYYQRDFY